MGFQTISPLVNFLAVTHLIILYSLQQLFKLIIIPSWLSLALILWRYLILSIGLALLCNHLELVNLCGSLSGLFFQETELNHLLVELQC